MLRQYWKPAVIGFGAALLGGLVCLAGLHLYRDHATLHAVLNWAVAVQQAQQNAAPAVPK